MTPTLSTGCQNGVNVPYLTKKQYYGSRWVIRYMMSVDDTYVSNICRVHYNNRWDSIIEYLPNVGLILGEVIVVLSGLWNYTPTRSECTSYATTNSIRFPLSDRFIWVLWWRDVWRIWVGQRTETWRNVVLFGILIPTKYTIGMELNDVPRI